MSTEPKSVKDIFLAAVEKGPAERAAFLEKACAGDAALRQRVEALLKAHDEPGSFLEKPAAELAHALDPAAEPGGTPEESVEAAGYSISESGSTGPFEPPPERPGAVIGPYKLLQELGEGGMGTVYMAQQTEPVKRLVALKIIKAGMDSAEVLARFEQERQALAVMDHPNIAKVLDAGTIPLSEGREPPEPAESQGAYAPRSETYLARSGRPYFVMELVKGIPITKYCDQEHLSLKERLELFIPVCQAVQHAHQKGIIHRDLKPSNVIIALYDGRPVPKVIDFGVAKATGPKLTEQTMFTEVGRILGTLEYMAPEQAELNNLDIDTRADIYSLGVMLYELLTGSPPFTRQQLRSAAFDEMLRIIREVEPPKPSTKLSASNDLPSIAAKRKLEPKRLCKLVHGDLDWIVMKCLEKDRGRRYETANGLVMDVQCYLADEPVLASPPTVRYRVGKFVRKHRGPVLAAGIIGVLLVGGIFGTSLGFWRAERLRQIAEQREQEALHEKANAEASQKQAMDALRATTDDVVERLIGGKPMLGPAEKEFLENTLKRWQTFASEQGQGEQARAIRAEGTYRVANLRQNLGQHETALGGYQEANILFEKLAADFPTIPRYRHNLARSHNNLGNVLRDLGQRSQAEEAYRQALAIEEKLAAEFPAVSQYRDDLAKHLNNVGMMLARLDKGTEAETAYRKALAIHEKLAADFPDVPWYQQDLAKHHNNLGMLLAGLDKRAEAETAYRKALAIQEKLAADFPVVPEYRGDLARSYNDLGQRLANLGQRQKAEAAYRQALAIQQKLVAESPAVSQYRVDLAGSHNNLGVLLKDLGKRPEAEEAYRRALAIQEKLVAESPAVPKYRQELAISHSNLGKLLASLGKRPQAEEAYRQALAIQEKLVAEFPAVADYRIELGGNQCDFGSILGANKELERAIEWYGKAIATLDDALRQVRSDDRPRQYLRNAYWGRALAYYELMRHAEAAADWDKVAELSAEAERPQFRMNAAADHARAGQVDAAFLDAEELAKNANADTLYNAACVFALASAAPQSTPLSQATREKYAQRAVALLQQAVAKGWKNIEHMKKDDDLKSLRDREDFKKLLGELEKNSPFSKNIQPNPK